MISLSLKTSFNYSEDAPTTRKNIDQEQTQWLIAWGITILMILPGRETQINVNTVVYEDHRLKSKIGKYSVSKERGNDLISNKLHKIRIIPIDLKRYNHGYVMCVSVPVQAGSIPFETIKKKKTF